MQTQMQKGRKGQEISLIVCFLFVILTVKCALVTSREDFPKLLQKCIKNNVLRQLGKKHPLKCIREPN